MKASSGMKNIPKLVYSEPESDIGHRDSSIFNNVHLSNIFNQFLSGNPNTASNTARSFAKFLIQEGKKYSQTSDGKRWEKLLIDSPAIYKGWILWHQSNAEFYIRNADDMEDDPITMLEELLNHLAITDIEKIVSDISNTTLHADIEDTTQEEINRYA